MSYANKALEELLKAGYEVHVSYVMDTVDEGYEDVPSDFIEFGKWMKPGEKILDNPNDILKLKCIGLEAVLPNKYNLPSGGSVYIYPSESFYFGEATNELVTLIEKVGYVNRGKMTK